MRYNFVKPPQPLSLAPGSAMADRWEKLTQPTRALMMIRENLPEEALTSKGLVHAGGDYHEPSQP